MKTRLLIISIIIGLIVSSGFAFIYNEMFNCLSPPGWLKMPRTFSFSDCLEQFASGNLSHYTRDSDTSSKEIFQFIQVIRPGDETLENFNGVIFDKRLGPEHWYNFFTNDPFKTFNTGSTGITLKGINSIDDLHGAIVNISGIRTDRDLGIQVYELQIFDSLIPSSTTGSVSNMKSILNVSLDTLYEDPDSYYNRFIRITGELREHENMLAYAGVGCDAAKYTTSDEFIPDGPSSRQLYVGEKFVGIRIDTHNDLGKVENELPSELKNNQVEIMGIFVPNIVDKGKCDHVIHKSGYILTKLDDIKIPSKDVPAESERKILQCYGIFNCNVSSQYFESCIGAKKNGVTIEQLCLDSDITIDNGCATIVFPDSTKTVSCHYED